MRYIVLATNNDGGRNATIHADLEAAKAAVREWLFDPEGDPVPTPEFIAAVEQELAIVGGDHVEGVRGPDAWKEWVYISPLDE